jgi:hypothetical protein
MNNKDLKYLFEAYNSMYGDPAENDLQPSEETLNKLVSGFLNVIAQTDENLNYDVFAKAVAKILKEEYGSHLYDSFVEEIKKNLNLESSYEESTKLTTESKKKVNPWAVCGKIKNSDKKERCVKDVKKSAKKYKKEITSKSVKENKK